MASSYTPGTWLGIVRSRTVVLLGSDAPPALVHSLWDLLENGPEVHEVLHAVTSSFGLSLAQIPWFGILGFRDSLRVFLRGDLELTVQLAGGPVDLNGRDVTTWTERSFAAPEWYRVTAPESGPAGQELPLGEGVVLLQSLTVALAGTPVAGVHAPAVAQAAVTQAAVPARAVAETAVPETAVPETAVSETAVPETAVSETAVPGTAVPGIASISMVEPEPVVEPEPEPEPEPQAALETVKSAAEHGASADTVMGVIDEDPDAATEMPDSWQDVEPPSRPDHVPDEAPEQVPAHELTGTYDHLWERTVVRSIEDAAVRDDPDMVHGGAPALAPAEVDGADGQAALEAPAASERQTGSVPPGPPAPEPESARPAPAGGLVDGGLNVGGLIDSVPWRTGGGNVRSPQAPPSFNTPAGAIPASPAGAIPASPAGPGPGSQPPAVAEELPGADPLGFDGDHDGHTVMKSDLAGMAGHPAPAAVPDPDAAGPLVLARVCGQGHANPPTHSLCAACGLPLPSDAVQVARPRLGRMRVSSGELVDLDQSLVIGRQPSVSRVQGGVMPRLVQVASPSGDISRSHVEVRLEGWHVMLCDLKATNGTVLIREGQQPRRLAQNEMAILLDGDIAELGDDISLRFEEIL
jgi:hypothetical protein